MAISSVCFFGFGDEMKNMSKLPLNQNPFLFLHNDDDQEQQGSFNQSITEDSLHESERFRILASKACPWSHKVLIVSRLKKLNEIISISFANPLLQDRGWTFGSGHDVDFLEDVYRGAEPNYNGRFTLPLLWDNRTQKIVNNSSEAICQMLDKYDGAKGQITNILYPEDLSEEINQVNQQLHINLNVPIIKSGMTQRQSLYEKYCEVVFDTLNSLESLLSHRPFLLGDKLTGSDIKLFVTLIRFDVVYYSLFHCNLKRLKDFHHLFNYTKSIFQIDGIASTCDFVEIKQHYFKSHIYQNSHRVIPIGPFLEFDTPHDRGRVDFFTK